jgi:hypothetical protein
VTIPGSFRMNGSSVEDKGILVAATDDVIVYGRNDMGTSGDSFLGLPVDVLSTEYIVPSWPVNNVGGDKYTGQLGNYQSTEYIY